MLCTLTDTTTNKVQRYARETEYAGIMFRSELEAMWAHTFDALNISWIYEPIRFRLARLKTQGSMKSYTPDFALPESRCLLEIKPSRPHDDELLRASFACEMLGPLIYFVCGYPGDRLILVPRQFKNGRYGFIEDRDEASLPFKI